MSIFIFGRTNKADTKQFANLYCKMSFFTRISSQGLKIKLTIISNTFFFVVTFELTFIHLPNQ